MIMLITGGDWVKLLAHKVPWNLCGILSYSWKEDQYLLVSASPTWSNFISKIKWVRSKFLLPLLVFGKYWSLINPINGSFYSRFKHSRSLKCCYSDEYSPFCLDLYDFIFVEVDWINCCLVQRAIYCLWQLLIFLSGWSRALWVCWWTWSYWTQRVSYTIGVGWEDF